MDDSLYVHATINVVGSLASLNSSVLWLVRTLGTCTFSECTRLRLTALYVQAVLSIESIDITILKIVQSKLPLNV